MARVRALTRFRDAREKAHDPGDLFECDDDEALQYAERGEVEVLADEVKTSASRSVQPESTPSAPSGEQQPTEDAAPQPTQTTTSGRRKRRKGSSGAS